MNLKYLNEKDKVTIHLFKKVDVKNIVINYHNELHG